MGEHAIPIKIARWLRLFMHKTFSKIFQYLTQNVSQIESDFGSLGKSPPHGVNCFMLP